MGDTFLHDVWTYYFHDPDDANWTTESYHRLADVASVGDFWEVHNAVSKYLSRGMFFVMREHVYPCWDDPHNIRGGCLSIKVLKDELPAFWDHLLMHMLGENLVKGEPSSSVEPSESRENLVNGLSVSPKRYFCIVKVWLAEGSPPDRSQYNMPPGYSGEVLYRSNMENIRGKNNALSDRLGHVPEVVPSM
jgi:hypothetical protein